MRVLFTCIACGLISWSMGQELPRLYQQNRTYTYDSLIAAYTDLHARFPKTTQFKEAGKTDSGEPLHVFYVGAWKKTNATILILNGIHPGEPCGVDASLHFAEELLMRGVPDSVSIAIIPAYNIGGMLNRGCCSRANQNGPEAYGFRGNARNLDLNRDFIKMDSRNAQAFARLFRKLKPDYFVDTHATNGADYQYVLTLIPTQSDKLGGQTGRLLREELTPYLTRKVTASGYLTGPYVNVFGRTPEPGFAAFLDYPRYSGGFAALYHTLAFTTEAHMWKPYEQRVEATRSFLNHLTTYASENRAKVKAARLADQQEVRLQPFIPIDWAVDSTKYETRDFRGYKTEQVPSEVTGQDRLRYLPDSPQRTQISYWNRYKPTKEVSVPQAYVVPQAWGEVIKRLRLLGARGRLIKQDTTVEVTAYYLQDVRTRDTPYEGHYYHDSVRVESRQIAVYLRAGDLWIETGKQGRLLSSVLEPEAPDSFFRWNFFDAVLQQKEWFSGYVWEDKAAEMLREDPELKKSFEAAKAENSVLANSAFFQLYWLYQRSPYFEPTAFRYPVFRVD